MREQRQALNQLKFLGNELRVSIVALGTSEALYAMQTDPQIASCFEPFALPHLGLDRLGHGVERSLEGSHDGA